MESGEQSGFVRQRRNLIVISLVLLFSEVSDLQIAKINFFGNELLIGTPTAISAALWIAGIYWLIRYYQYSRPLAFNAIKNAIALRLSQLAPATALKLALQAHPEFHERYPEIPADPVVSVKTYAILQHEPGALELELELQKAAAVKNNGAASGLGSHRVRITGVTLLKLQLRAWMHLIIHTTHFTEYILPYLLFALPILYWVLEPPGLWRVVP